MVGKREDSSNQRISHFREFPLTLYHPIPTFSNPKKKALENTVGKGENAGKQPFLFSPSVFYSKRKTVILSKFYLSSANAFNLVTSKILLSGKGLNALFLKIHNCLTLSQTTNFRLVHIEKVCRQQFQFY